MFQRLARKSIIYAKNIQKIKQGKEKVVHVIATCRFVERIISYKIHNSEKSHNFHSCVICAHLENL